MAEATANVRGPVVRGNIDVRSKRRRTRAYYSNRVRYYVRPTKKENTLVKMFTKITFVNAAIKLSTLSYPGHSYIRATSGRVKKPFPSLRAVIYRIYGRPAPVPSGIWEEVGPKIGFPPPYPRDNKTFARFLINYDRSGNHRRRWSALNTNVVEDVRYEKRTAFFLLRYLLSVVPPNGYLFVRHPGTLDTRYGRSFIDQTPQRSHWFNGWHYDSTRPI